jgi:hypothetical protein
MTYVIIFLAAVVVGMAVESHWCGHRHQARRWEAVARREHDRLLEALSAARRWRGASRHWHRTAEGHAEMLRALGRAVAEGQGIESTEGTSDA